MLKKGLCAYAVFFPDCLVSSWAIGLAISGYWWTNTRDI